MVGIICPPPVGIGLTDLPNIGGASGPPCSGIIGVNSSHGTPRDDRPDLGTYFILF